VQFSTTLGRAKSRESEHGAISRFHLNADPTADRSVVRLRMQTCRAAYAVGESLDDPHRSEQRGSNEAQRGEIVSCEFVVAGGDAPEILEPAIAALNDIAALIGLLVMTDTLLAI
jgi:hypothetical protein